MPLPCYTPSSFPQDTHHFLLPASHGHLELQTDARNIIATNPISIICHPHPRKGGGGTMHNKVVVTMSRFFQTQKIATIRFNFREVGQSTGVFSNGIGELEDLITVLKWVRHLNLERPRVILAGFSFGSFVAASIANYPEWTSMIQQLILVAPSVERFDFNSLKPFSFPWSVIQGEGDTIVNPTAVKNWFNSRQPSGTYYALPGVGHFFHQKLDELKYALAKIGIF